MEAKQPWGVLILRIVFGLIFFSHGLDKFQGGIETVAQWFESIGIPGFLAWVVASIELGGGIALILGLGTRVVSFLIGIVMVVAIWKVKLANGLLGTGQASGYEFDLILLAVAIYFMTNGSSFYALDSMMNQNVQSYGLGLGKRELKDE